jgi:hypothetical protein
MSSYILSASALSPQETFGEAAFPKRIVPVTGERLACLEPDYRERIDPALIRRMSRIIKMGVAAASDCLRHAGIEMPDGIITGTGYGCQADSIQFLTRIVEQDEQMLSPTCFIQSTHNTVGGQIALMLGCHGYNNTFVHRGVSFENALLDAMMLLDEEDGTIRNVLVGSVDEITETSHALLRRFGLYRRGAIPDGQLFSPGGQRGTIAGEGAAFFVLGKEAGGDSAIRLDGMSTFYKPDSVSEIEERIARFLTAQGTDLAEIDLVITGRNGDASGDAVYDRLGASIFRYEAMIPYKQLCGEYPTSASFALWYASRILKAGRIPDALEYDFLDIGPIRRILIYNHFFGIHHSLMLVSAG